MSDPDGNRATFGEISVDAMRLIPGCFTPIYLTGRGQLSER